MTYFADLTPYKLFSEFDVDGFLNVGWLDNLHDYPKGDVPDSVVSKLRRILLDKRDVNRMRGIFPCVFCGVDTVRLEVSNQKKLLGMSEIWIPTSTEIIYAAPSLIYHYITEHQYKPPQEFLDAVEAFGETFHWVSDEVLYKILIRRSKRK